VFGLNFGQEFWLPWLGGGFVFWRPPHSNSWLVPELGHVCLLPNPFQFIIHRMIWHHLVNILTVAFNNPGITNGYCWPIQFRNLGEMINLWNILWSDLQTRTVYSYQHRSSPYLRFTCVDSIFKIKKCCSLRCEEKYCGTSECCKFVAHEWCMIS
jgi:hypothetical protein